MVLPNCRHPGFLSCTENHIPRLNFIKQCEKRGKAFRGLQLRSIIINRRTHNRELLDLEIFFVDCREYKIQIAFELMLEKVGRQIVLAIINQIRH